MNFQPKFDSAAPIAEPTAPQDEDRRSRSLLFRLSLVFTSSACHAALHDRVRQEA